MKYNININQKKSYEWGLNSSEAIVFSWIYELASWAEKLEYEGTIYYYANRRRAIEEIPIVTNKPDTMYRIYKSLKDKNIINIISLNKKDYVCITEYGKEWHDDGNSEKNPSLGKKTKEAEIFPTYNINNIKKEYNNKEDTNVSKKVIEVESHDEDYIKFRKWMKDNCPFCDNPNNMKSSVITEDEFHKLKENYSSSEIANIILEIENRKDLRKKYCNLYTTALKWLRNDNTKK